MNVVYNDKKIELINYNNEKTYSLDELVFYIPNKIKKTKYFLVLTDGGAYDVVYLKLTNSTSKMYFNYVCDMSSPLKVKSGKCKMCLLLIDETTNEIVSSTLPFDISLDFGFYNFKSKIYIIGKLSGEVKRMYQDISSMYNNMLSLTKLNIDAISSQNGEEVK